jgi:hypothetical protein
VLKSTNSQNQKISFDISASAESPIKNVAIVVHNWNAPQISLQVNQQRLKEENDYTVGYTSGLEENQTIIFLKMNATKRLVVEMENLSK